MSRNAAVEHANPKQSFSDATSWRLLGDGRFAGAVDPVWGQGCAVYGGIVAAGMARAMEAAVADDKTLRSFTVTFAGPVEAGEVECVTGLLREGRTATFVSAEITQGGTKRAAAQKIVSGVRYIELAGVPGFNQTFMQASYLGRFRLKEGKRQKIG